MRGEVSLARLTKGSMGRLDFLQLGRKGLLRTPQIVDLLQGEPTTLPDFEAKIRTKLGS